MIYNLMKKKIARDGLTDENKTLLDIYLAAGRIAQAQYEELMGIN